MANLKLNQKPQNNEGNNYIIQDQQDNKNKKQLFQNKTLNKILLACGIAFAVILVICIIILAIPID